MLTVERATLHFNQDNTPISAQFDDIYFSTQDGLAETDYVFLQGNHLWERWCCFDGEHFVIAETGFGTGLNFFAVSALFNTFKQKYPNSPLKRLFFISFEKYPLAVDELAKAHSVYPQFTAISQQLQQQWLTPIAGCYRFHFEQIYLDIWFGDVADNLPQLGDYMHERIDAWFLDGFAPSKNPQMWNEQLYQQMFRLSKKDGTFATFTAASAVRKGLENAGFKVQKRKGFGKKRECLSGCKMREIAHKTVEYPWYLPQPALSPKQDIAIIGGGIAAFCTAAALISRGASVTLYCLDSDVATNASSNRQGAFYPQLSDDDLKNIRFYLHAFPYAYHFLQRCLANGIEVAYQRCGVALCGYSQKSAQKLTKIAAQDWSQPFVQTLTAEELSAKAGLPLECDGLFIPDGGWLAPQQWVRNGIAWLKTQGLQLKTSHNITALHQTENGWALHRNEQMMAHHQIVILANGHQLKQFEQTAHLPLYPVRGQVSHIPTSDQLKKLKTVLCYDGYLTPFDSRFEMHCLGASHWRDDQSMAFSEQDQQDNAVKLQQNIRMSWTQQVDISHNDGNVGIRCSVRDRVPMVGNVPDFSAQEKQYRQLYNLRRRRQEIENAAHHKQLYLIGALGSRGLTSAPLLGECLASLIYGEPLPLSQDIWHNLSANRSWVRKWLKGSQVERLV